jgi:hypothetical protein
MYSDYNEMMTLLSIGTFLRDPTSSISQDVHDFVSLNVAMVHVFLHRLSIVSR